MAPKLSQLSSINIKLLLLHIFFKSLISQGLPSRFTAKIILVFVVIASSILFILIFSVSFSTSTNTNFKPY